MSEVLHGLLLFWLYVRLHFLPPVNAHVYALGDTDKRALNVMPFMAASRAGTNMKRFLS